MGIKKAAEIISRAKKLFIVTGAGISASSGIPTFRDKDGLWKKEDIVKFGSQETWISDPWTCWFAYEKFRLQIDAARPTLAHHFIKRLENLIDVQVATTNVDSLHHRIGTSALEIHGTLRTLRCMACQETSETILGVGVEHPACPKCGNWRRHDVVLWGENIKDFEKFESSVEEADTLLMIGMSGAVTSTKELSKRMKRKGGSVIEINPSLFTPATLHTNVSIRKNADEACKTLEKLLFK